MLDETGREIELGVTDDERAKRRAVLDKTTGQELKRNWEQEDREEIEAAEKRLAPPVITEPKCHVCTSEHRHYMELCLTKGYAYQTIANSVPTDSNGKKPSRKSLANHWKEHMPIDRQVVRGMLEEDADLLQQNYETGAKGALTNRGILNRLIRKAWEDAEKGVTTVEPKDLVQMMKLQNEMNNSVAQTKNEEIESEFRIFVMAIQQVCDHDMLNQITDKIKQLRGMDDIDTQMERHLEQPIELPAAEVIDETARTTSDD